QAARELTFANVPQGDRLLNRRTVVQAHETANSADSRRAAGGARREHAAPFGAANEATDGSRSFHRARCLGTGRGAPFRVSDQSADVGCATDIPVSSRVADRTGGQADEAAGLVVRTLDLSRGFRAFDRSGVLTDESTDATIALRCAGSS